MWGHNECKAGNRPERDNILPISERANPPDIGDVAFWNRFLMWWLRSGSPSDRSETPAKRTPLRPVPAACSPSV